MKNELTVEKIIVITTTILLVLTILTIGSFNTKIHYCTNWTECPDGYPELSVSPNLEPICCSHAGGELGITRNCIDQSIEYPKCESFVLKGECKTVTETQYLVYESFGINEVERRWIPNLNSTEIEQIIQEKQYPKINNRTIDASSGFSYKTINRTTCTKTLTKNING